METCRNNKNHRPVEKERRKKLQPHIERKRIGVSGEKKTTTKLSQSIAGRKKGDFPHTQNNRIDN